MGEDREKFVLAAIRFAQHANHRFIRAATFADIAIDRKQPPNGAVAKRREVRFDAQLTAIAQDVRALAAPLPARLQRGFHHRFVFRIQPANVVQFTQATPQHREYRDAVQPFCGRIQIDDAPIGIGRDHRVAHLRENFAAKPIRLRVDAFEREHARPVRTVDHQCVDFTAANRAQHLFRFCEPHLQLGFFREQLLHAVVGTHFDQPPVPVGARSITSRPARMRARLRHVADEASYRERQRFDQRGRRDDLLALRQHRRLRQIDDFQLVTPGQVHLAEVPDVRERTRRMRGRTGDVQTQHVVRRRLVGESAFEGVCGIVAFPWLLNPYRVDVETDQHPLFVGQVADDLLDRFRQSPYQRRQGENLVSRASCGVSSRSMISIRYWPARCDSQMRRRLAKAASDLAL